METIILSCYTLIYYLYSITGDERDFFVPEDLVLQETYGSDEHFDIPYVQVNTNHIIEINVNEETICIVCRDNTRTHALVPCGHKVLCEDCVNLLIDKRCPLCRVQLIN
jgi:hypothetical protein